MSNKLCKCGQEAHPAYNHGTSCEDCWVNKQGSGGHTLLAQHELGRAHSLPGIGVDKHRKGASVNKGTY